MSKVEYWCWDSVVCEGTPNGIQPITLDFGRKIYGGFDYYFYHQNGLIENWNPNEKIIIEEDGPLADVLATVSFWKLVSSRLRIFLEERLKDELQFLPVKIERIDGTILDDYCMVWPLIKDLSSNHKMVADAEGGADIYIDLKLAREMIAQDFRGLIVEKKDSENPWRTIDSIETVAFFNDLSYPKPSAPTIDDVWCSLADPTRKINKTGPSIKKFIKYCQKRFPQKQYRLLSKCDFDDDLHNLGKWFKQHLTNKPFGADIGTLTFQLSDDSPPYRLRVYGMDHGGLEQVSIFENRGYLSDEFFKKVKKEYLWDTPAPSAFLKLHGELAGDIFEEDTDVDEKYLEDLASRLPGLYCALIAICLSRKLGTELLLLQQDNLLITYTTNRSGEMWVAGSITKSGWVPFKPTQLIS